MVYSDRLRFLNPALPDRQPLYRFGYAMDPDPVMSCPRLKPAARLVYRAILRLCGRGTTCRASVDQIAAQAGVSVRSVQRHVLILTCRALVEVEDTPGSETIFRLLPLPAWLVEGRKPVFQEGERRKHALSEVEGGNGERENRAEEETGTLSSLPLSLSPSQGRQLDTPGVTDCRGRGDKLSPPMKNNKETKKETPISLSWPGTQSGTERTDELPASERERVGEKLEPVMGEEKAETPPTPQQIVRTTCQALGFQPTEAQVAFGVREVAALFAGGFTLPEIGQGARYAAEKGWVRSFAGVKFYLPQALNALALKAAKETEEPPPEARQPDRRADDALERRQMLELSPHRALWEQVLERVESRISRQSYQTWFSPTFIADYDGRQVVLETPSVFFQEWLEAHYLALITSAFEEVLGNPVEVTVGVSTGGPGGVVASATTADQMPEGGG